MYTRCIPLLLYITLIQLSSSYASPSLHPALDLPVRNVYAKRDDHHHNHHAAPLLELNETEVTLYHSPTPPSYYTLDWEDEGYQKQHGNLMILHGLFMSLAFFVALPMGIALRSVKHTAHWMATFSFYLCCALGCAASGLYRKLTPNMYEGAVHREQGYIIILVAISLSAIDIVSTARRLLGFVKKPNKSLKGFWRCIMNKQVEIMKTTEYDALIQNEPENSKIARDSIELDDFERNNIVIDDHETGQWADAMRQHRRHYSINSEGTLFEPHSPTHSEDTLHDVKVRQKAVSSLLSLVGQAAFAVVERSIVLAGFGQLLIGIVTYTGGCRENYQNGCLAHLIKGGIFWCYGLLTFGRFLGSFADLGWAWNRLPSDHYTAEFVESFVIFLYGVTNTWMERFGANPGDPFTTKQIQHISIAVMFCFAGLIGMGIESQSIRKWLAHSVFPPTSQSSDLPKEAIAEPQSYIGSFNPFPALVIGVTGAAMAAHVQTYLFQVQIHALWGNLLVAFAVLRCLTYFFLWLGPPKSILPSRPPTEALGSFFLACGGLVFIFSTEEVTIAAMRRGRDDVMMFLNVAVAITCVAFCWTLCMVGFKGWLKSRMQTTLTYRPAA